MPRTKLHNEEYAMPEPYGPYPPRCLGSVSSTFPKGLKAGVPEQQACQSYQREEKEEEEGHHLMWKL